MTKYSVKKPFTVLVGVILVLVLGVVSFLGLNTDLLPAMDLPYVVVVTTYPGASPERVETSVTQPLEQALATTSGLENINSVSAENMSMIILEFGENTNMDSAMIELDSSIDMVSGYFDDMVAAPMVMKINPDMLPIQMLSVDVDGMDIKQLTEYMEDNLAPRLERIEGVATVDVSGAVSDHVDIFLNQEKIDRINDKVLKAVDSSLYSAKKELDDAKKELADGKARMEAKEQEAYDKLADASARLDAGQAQAQAVAAEKARLEAEKAMLEGAKKAFRGLSALRQGKMRARGALTSRPRLGLTESNTVNEFISRTVPGYLPPQVSEGIKALQQGLSAMVSSGALDGQLTLKRADEKIRRDINDLEDSLGKMGFTREEIAAGGSAVCDDKLARLAPQLEKATFMAQQMEGTLKKLQDSYARMEKAKMQTTAQLAAAKVQLGTAQAQLDSGIKEFESARDSALKSANIDSLVTRDMLSNILTAQNFSMPAGYITDGGEKLTVKVGETFENIDQLNNLLLVDMGIAGLDPIYLKDVADISIADNSADSYVRINGNPGVFLSLQKSSTASTSQVCKAVNREIRQIMSENDKVHITTLMDQGIYIEMVVNSVMENLIYGGIIALAVLMFFLKDLKPTLIIGFSIPISVLFAIVLMYFSGVTLNIISLSGLALGVGMLVDNSIVVIENTYRLRNLGYPAVKAAVLGAKQVGGAIAASTLTTICVFVPILFTQGLSRQLFTDMGLTIGYSLVASLIVALTLVPAMASNMLTQPKEEKPGLFTKLLSGYEKALSFSLNHKWIVITLTVVLLAYSFYSAFKMPMAFIPSMDSTQMQMTLTLPAESSEQELIAKSERLADNVMQIEDVQTVGMSMGTGTGISLGGSSSGEKAMSFYVVLKEDKSMTNEEIAQLIKENNAQLGDSLSVSASNMDISALAGSGISIKIKGNDLDGLREEAAKLADKIKDVSGVVSVDDGQAQALEEIRITVDKEEAMKNGLTVAQVYAKVAAALTESTTATTLSFEQGDLDAVIHAPATYDRRTVGSLTVGTRRDDADKDLLLKDIADISTAQSPDAINRENQSRFITVTANVADGYNVALVSRDVRRALDGYTMPRGYSYEIAGENEVIMSAMADMIKMIALAVIFIYLIMVAQFQSLKSPFIVLFTIPLAFTGGLLALQITGEMLTITSMIGFLVLAGVVVNNGIVFVDYVNSLRLEGMEKRRALIQTGKDRIRPILMTALTTILAMSTMALGVGMGADMSQGMAVVTIGGLSYATLLTLFLVPALYDIFNRKDMKQIQVDFDDE